jgi:phage recombination protein Bet
MNAPVKKAEKQQLVAVSEPRLPYHPYLDTMGVDKQMWRVLCESVFPAAQTIEGIALAVRYCNAQGYDVMKRTVHVVPMWNSKLKKNVETVWPGIGAYRTIASRTGEYGGCDPTECGSIIEKTFEGAVDKWENGQKSEQNVSVTLHYHEWMRCTVYRIIKGVRCAFPGPKVYFEEIYSRVRHNVEVPNDRWQKAPNGQLEKCAEAAALRKAFPEVGDYTAEEMEGKVIEAGEITVLPKVTPKDVEQQVDEHLETIGAKPQTVEPDADWNAVLESELFPGIHVCKTEKELSDFIGENEELIGSMDAKASKAIKDKFIGEIEKTRANLKGKR